MKKIPFANFVVAFAFCLSLLVISCGSNDPANAENKDTVSTYMEPKPDNATVRPDTMQTQIPQDSARKDSTN